MTPQEIVTELTATVEANLVRMCQELVQFENTGVLADGMIRKLSRKASEGKVLGDYGLCQNIVISTIRQKAIKQVAGL